MWSQQKTSNRLLFCRSLKIYVTNTITNGCVSFSSCLLIDRRRFGSGFLVKYNYKSSKSNSEHKRPVFKTTNGWHLTHSVRRYSPGLLSHQKNVCMCVSVWEGVFVCASVRKFSTVEHEWASSCLCQKMDTQYRDGGCHSCVILPVFLSSER